MMTIVDLRCCCACENVTISSVDFIDVYRIELTSEYGDETALVE